MSNQNDLSKMLPLMAYKEIPTPGVNAKQITALVKKEGRVAGYQLSDGTTLSKAEAVQAARQGDISGVGIAVRKGNEYLKSLPDTDEANNLGNLPSVVQ